MNALLVALFAGKLAADNGFRGAHFGPDTALADPPMTACQASSEDGVKWLCQSTIANQPVQVYYFSSYGYFSSVMLKAEGSTACTTIKAVLDEAWGAPIQPNQYIEHYVWRDRVVMASWKYNEAANDCAVLIFNKQVRDEQEAARKNAASRAVDDI
jgi:hypothetical protein